MYLESLSIINFKNYAQSDLRFSPAVNCIHGDNGSGKTNLLDAVHYLALTKSYFNPIDSQVIKHEEKMMMLKAEFSIQNNAEVITAALRSGQKKKVMRNKKEYAKVSEHIGLIPVVMISPFDSYLILEGSEVRRKFMDAIISQEKKPYLNTLIQYNRALQQRNLLLKHFSKEQYFDADSLDVWDAKLIEYGEEIYKERKAFLDNFIPVFQHFYSRISNEGEEVDLLYRSSLDEGNYREQLKANVKEDVQRQYTMRGIHKDDLIFSIEGNPLKKFASQGQQKTFLLALKLAQFKQMQEVMGETPILLLDDIYDKLDEKRMKQLLSLVSEDGFGQLFITDTHKDRVADLFSQSGMEVRSFEIKDGGVING